MLTSLLMIGCAATVEINRDGDGDGLLDPDEAAAGSSPSNPDSDGDGYDDGEEVASHTDPTDGEDLPYELGWRIDGCRDAVEGAGYAEGEVVADTTLVDQLEEEVRIHDFCDQVVLLDFSAGWCGACQAEAPELQAFFEEHEDEGFMAVTTYMENVDRSAPTLDEVQLWADTFGLTFPVLLDDQGFYNGFAQATGQSSIGLPLMVLIDRGMVVAMSQGATTDDALELLGG